MSLRLALAWVTALYVLGAAGLTAGMISCRLEAHERARAPEYFISKRSPLVIAPRDGAPERVCVSGTSRCREARHG